MAQIVCELPEILELDTCNDRGGIRQLYWTERKNIDFDAMLADPTKFDPVNELVLGYTMVGGATFNKVEFERKDAYYDFDFTEDTGVWSILMPMMFKGKSSDRRNKLQRAVQCCDIVAHIYDNIGNQRVIGIDYNGEVFDPIVKRLKVVRAKDASGQLGQSLARDEMDLGGESFFAPLFADVPVAELPLV